MPFFANAQNVRITESTFKEIHGDEIVYNGDVYNVDSYNRAQTDIRGSYNDSSDHSRGMRRHHTDQAVNRGSSPENQRGHQSRDNRTCTAQQGTQQRQNATSGQQPSHLKPGYSKSASFHNDRTSPQRKVVRMRHLAEGIRGMKIGERSLPGDSRAPREVGQVFGDDEDGEVMDEEEEEEESEMDDDRACATESGSSTQGSTSTSMNADRPPPSPSTSPSSAGINPSASETAQGPFPHAMGVQTHHYPAQAWYNGPVWTNDSYNTTTTDTRDSHNDSSINIVDSE